MFPTDSAIPADDLGTEPKRAFIIPSEARDSEARVA